jgi:1,4-alpha-glucan branching enzyme
MYKNGRKKGTVRFAIKPNGGTKKVQLAGCFNNWKPVPMQRQKSGSFVKVLSMSPGTYEYKFLVDGEWQHDLDHSDWAVNPHGTLNSVAQVQ